MNYPRYISAIAYSTAILLIAMFSISFVTGVNQQYFEGVDSYDVYTNALLKGENILRILLTIDGLFIASYWLLGIFLVLALWRDDRKFLLALSVACISGTAILDLVENSEFIMFMESLHKNLTIDHEHIQKLMVAGLVKWYLAYFAFLFLGFAFPTETNMEKTAAFIMKFVLLPVGILVFTIPASKALLFAHLSRFGFLVVLLILIGLIAGKWSKNVVRSS
jgi:uncharacterized membrane protein